MTTNDLAKQLYGIAKSEKNGLNHQEREAVKLAAKVIQEQEKFDGEFERIGRRAMPHDKPGV